LSLAYLIDVSSTQFLLLINWSSTFEIMNKVKVEAVITEVICQILTINVY